MSKHSVPAQPRSLHIMHRYAIMLLGVVLLLTLGAIAQEQRSEIGLQGTGFFTKDASGQGISQHATDTGGFLVSYRYRLNRWLAAQADYGFNRNTQQYLAPLGTSRVQADVHQATGGFVVNLPAPARWKISPYLLAEGGALVFNPTSNAGSFVPGADTQTRGVFVYGGGADFPIVRHVSLRTEYRGLVYNTPDFGLKSLQTSTVTHTAQPSAGIVFRF